MISFNVNQELFTAGKLLATELTVIVVQHVGEVLALHVLHQRQPLRRGLAAYRAFVSGDRTEVSGFVGSIAVSGSGR